MNAHPGKREEGSVCRVGLVKDRISRDQFHMVYKSRLNTEQNGVGKHVLKPQMRG